VAEIAREAPEIIPAYGVHPWAVHELGDGWLEGLKSRLAQGPCVLGEVGLDGRLARADMGRQVDVLRQELRLAQELALPVSVHCLDAWSPLLDMLDEFPGLSVNIHAFAHPASLDRLKAYGAFFSFNAALTSSGHGNMKKALMACPVERILLETDAPDFPLAQAGLVDKSLINTPASLPLVLRAAADPLGLAPETLAGQCHKNSRAYLASTLGGEEGGGGHG
jgi:TatD DNase family protein